MSSRRSRLRHNWNPLLAGELRAAERAWRLGPDPVCARCGEPTHAVLGRVKGEDGKKSEILCYACRVDGDERRATEIDHPLGRRRSRHHTVVVPANENQLFNDPDDGAEARLRWALEPSERLARLLRRR